MIKNKNDTLQMQGYFGGKVIYEQTQPQAYINLQNVNFLPNCKVN